MEMPLTNAITGEELRFRNDLTSGDNISYYMFPDHSKILCQLIDDTGVFIKEDGTFGEQKVWCKVCDQRCFKSDILYWVIPLSKINENGEYNIENGKSTRASLVYSPESKILPN